MNDPVPNFEEKYYEYVNLTVDDWNLIKEHIVRFISVDDLDLGLEVGRLQAILETLDYVKSIGPTPTIKETDEFNNQRKIIDQELNILECERAMRDAKRMGTQLINRPIYQLLDSLHYQLDKAEA